MQWPGAARDGPAAAQYEVGGAVEDEPGDSGQKRGVEGGVAVAEAHDVGRGGGQARVAGGAEAAPRLVDDMRPEGAGDVRGAVGGAVVDDDRAPARGDAVQHPRQGLGLVEAGQHHVHRSRRRGGCFDHSTHPTDAKRAKGIWWSYGSLTSGAAPTDGRTPV